MNPASTMLWSLHKGYLKDLESGGVPVVPTAFFEAGESIDVVGLASERDWGKVVIKPTVGAGSFGTRVFDLRAGAEHAAQSFFDSMIGEREMMVQEFVNSVETIGETALIVIDGQLTHAIEKRPRFDDQDEQVLLRETINDEMRSLVDQVLQVADKEHLFARVDVMPGNDGRLLLSELEMLEPSLFFPYCEDAVGVMVRGVERRIQKAIGSS
jgi:hypothetical protein